MLGVSAIFLNETDMHYCNQMGKPNATGPGLSAEALLVI